MVGAALLDAAALLWAFQLGWSDPLIYVAPVSLSALLVAQVLRGRVSPQTVGLTRYAAAGVLYITGFGQMVADPRITLVVMLLALAGIVAGQLLRARSYLQLGLGLLGTALVWNLIRFGLLHSRFWALVLTGLGMAVLATMVVITQHREALGRMRDRLAARLASWEM